MIVAVWVTSELETPSWRSTAPIRRQIEAKQSAKLSSGFDFALLGNGTLGALMDLRSRQTGELGLRDPRRDLLERVGCKAFSSPNRSNI